MTKRAKPVRGRKPTIWIGRYKFGTRPIYAVTAASTREQCLALIEGGPFFNTEALQWTLTLTSRTQKMPNSPKRRRRGAPLTSRKGKRKQ